MEFSFTLDSISEAAQNLWQQVGASRVLAFHGDMGAGKTTLIHALCVAQGVKDVVGSPTFSIINEYRTMDGQPIFHMDLYRLKNEAEAVQAGVEDALYSDAICLVEWPDRAPGIFPPGTVHVYLQIIDSASRQLKIGGK
jgi:tRNA threonylcarbamoyladenosine biosynthesis protein TsaE